MSRASASRSAEHWVLLVAALLAPLGLLALGLALDPDPRGWGTHEQLGFAPCFPMAHWNVPCPGCGITTAVVLAVRGEPLQSLRVQPFGWIVLVAAVASAFWALAGHLRGRDLQHELGLLPWGRLWRILGLLLVGAWLYKLARVRGWIG